MSREGGARPPGQGGEGPPPGRPFREPAIDAELRLRRRRLDEFDAPAEVDAAFRTQRRIAVGYFVVFLLVVLAPPSLSLALGWWTEGRLFGGMNPNFALVAVGLYAFFFLLFLAAATLANSVEDRMLGGPQWDDEEGAEERPG